MAAVDVSTSAAENPRITPPNAHRASARTASYPAETPAAASPATATTTVTVRYFAAARAASGIDEEPVTVPAPATVDTVLRAATFAHGAELERVLTRCSYLHNEVAVHNRGEAMAEGDQLDILPPFAGG